MSTARTPWFPAHVKPKRLGLYEAKMQGGFISDVHWRVLQDTSEPSFYVYKGVLGPFNCWEDVTHKMKSWRGLRNKPRKQP